LIGIASMVSLTVAANLMLKLGAMVPPTRRTVLGIFRALPQHTEPTQTPERLMAEEREGRM
jgi:hypothetical protein